MICVLLWDEDSFVLDAMQTALAGQPDINVIDVARTVEQAMQSLAFCQTDVLVMNAWLSDANVFDVIPSLQAIVNPPRILIVSVLDHVEEARSIRDLGVHGYFLRCEPISLFVDAVRQVAQGCRWISPEMAQRLNMQPSKSPSLDQLSTREIDVLRLMAYGHSNSEIAVRLSICAGTVKNHIANIYRKLDVRNERAAISFAWHNGLGDQ
jgi:DNA-binding NarL/FixJ family response regulator